MSQKYLLFDFLEDLIAAAPNGSPLDGVELHDTVHQTVRKDRGLRLSNTLSNPAPKAGGVADEYDVRIIVTSFARIKGPERSQRRAAEEAAKAIALKVAEAILNDQGLGGRTCRTRVIKLIDDFDELTTDELFAVNNLYVVVNSTGRPLNAPFNEE